MGEKSVKHIHVSKKRIIIQYSDYCVNVFSLQLIK